MRSNPQTSLMADGDSRNQKVWKFRISGANRAQLAKVHLSKIIIKLKMNLTLKVIILSVECRFH